MIRVSTDPNDPHYDERPRRVWCNDREVEGWTVADEFRRCVITPDGVIYGAVLVERLPEPVGEDADLLEVVQSRHDQIDSAVDVDVDDLCSDSQAQRNSRKPKRKPWR
jgi:hypothetical protein